ncbi:eps8-like1 isoform X1 [Silurus meridionalis]|nr:eps8-like1 isoform X1 [Silurus meridionalis]
MVCVKLQALMTATGSQLQNLASACRLIAVIYYKADDNSVTCILQELDRRSVEVQWLVYREKSSGKRTHPWGGTSADSEHGKCIIHGPVCSIRKLQEMHCAESNGVLNGQPDKALLKAQQEVDMLNHCFEEIEMFMAKLQQAAEAQNILEQRNKKKKSRKKEDDLLSAKAKTPPEVEFLQIFQKFKYSFCLLARLNLAIANPTSDELLHHIFKPLDMRKRTVKRQVEKSLERWRYTLERRGMKVSRNCEDYRKPCISSISEKSSINSGGNHTAQRKPNTARTCTLELTGELLDTIRFGLCDGGPMKERLYSCSYDFVARNSSELSVLQGETLEVIESSKRWWKCRNRFNEVGFVPFNILEPVSHIESLGPNKPPKAFNKKCTCDVAWTHDWWYH